MTIYRHDEEKMTEINKKEEFTKGFKMGIPIALGYLSVAFTFGIMAASGGMSPWLAIFESFSNLTSSGQFAGTKLILASGSILEIALTVFVINIRYILMSISLSQKFDKSVGTRQRIIIGYGVTDEVFALASVQEKKLTAPFMYGLILSPVLGWTSGTAFGAFASDFMSKSLSLAMGIAIYAMFIAVIVPDMKKSRAVIFTVLLAIMIMTALSYISIFSFISDGFKVIITTLLASGIAAALFPIKDEKKSLSNVCDDEEEKLKFRKSDAEESLNSRKIDAEEKLKFRNSDVEESSKFRSKNIVELQNMQKGDES